MSTAWIDLVLSVAESLKLDPEGSHCIEEYNAGITNAVNATREALLESGIKRYPHVSNLSGDIIIGPECFASDDEQLICWKGSNYALVPE